MACFIWYAIDEQNKRAKYGLYTDLKTCKGAERRAAREWDGMVTRVLERWNCEPLGNIFQACEATEQFGKRFTAILPGYQVSRVI